MALNEVLFDFKLRNNISALEQNLTSQNNSLFTSVLRSLACADAENAFKHAAYHIAKNYNKKHEELSLKVDDKVYLRLGSDYKLHRVLKAKLGLQCVGPFTILEKVSNLAYKLQLSDDWRIHPIISVAQLESAKEDPFNRDIPPPSSVDADDEKQ